MKATFITILLALLLGGGGTFLWMYYGGFGGEGNASIAFIDAYGDYNEVAEKVELLVHLPGTEGNTDRAELLTLLNTILTENIDPSRRESLARLAYTNLDTIKKEIDTAQIAQADLYKILQDLNNASRVFLSIDLRNRASEIVTLARARASLSAEITSVLSETNEHTYAIITRILSEKGELSSIHITDINNATTEAEKRYDRLSDLYESLVNKKIEIDRLFSEFAQVAL